MKTVDVNKGAEFSDCEKYRYALWRIWDETKPLVMFVGLNPSTANCETDDPTIKSVTRISKENGYGGFYMMNLFAIISSDPKILKTTFDSFGDNAKWSGKIAKCCVDVVFAWGRFKEAKGLEEFYILAYPNALCIGKNMDGSPKHPLFQKGDSKLIKY